MGGEPLNYNHYTIHENMVWLAPREHFRAHEILVEENPNNYKLVSALYIMAVCDINSENKYCITADEYEAHKIEKIKLLSERQQGENNSIHRLKDPEAFRQHRSEAQKEYYKDPKNREKTSLAMKEASKKYPIWNKGISPKQESVEKYKKTMAAKRAAG